MSIDENFSLNLMSEEFPDSKEEYEEFKFHVSYLKNINRMKRLCLTNPVLAQKMTDPNSKMVARILLVRDGEKVVAQSNTFLRATLKLFRIFWNFRDTQLLTEDTTTIVLVSSDILCNSFVPVSYR